MNARLTIDDMDPCREMVRIKLEDLDNGGLYQLDVYEGTAIAQLVKAVIGAVWEKV